MTQEMLWEELVRLSWRVESEAGARLIGELSTRIRTRRVPVCGALTGKLGTGGPSPHWYGAWIFAERRRR